VALRDHAVEAQGGGQQRLVERRRLQPQLDALGAQLLGPLAEHCVIAGVIHGREDRECDDRWQRRDHRIGYVLVAWIEPDPTTVAREPRQPGDRLHSELFITDEGQIHDADGSGSAGGDGDCGIAKPRQRHGDKIKVRHNNLSS